MHEFIWKENKKFYRAVTDLIGTIVLQEEISEQEYNNYHNF